MDKNIIFHVNRAQSSHFINKTVKQSTKERFGQTRGRRLFSFFWVEKSTHHELEDNIIEATKHLESKVSFVFCDLMTIIWNNLTLSYCIRLDVQVQFGFYTW